jgi:uncharacterized protein YjbI with pentapeptide repeats
MTSAGRRLQAPRVAAQLDAAAGLVLDEDAEWVDIEASGDFSQCRAADVAISGSRLARAVFTGAMLDRVHLVDCVAEGCEWSGAVLDEGQLTRVEFRGCRMSGFVASRSRLRDVRFVDCRLDGASFRMAAGERVAFAGCDLRGADLTEAVWEQARFESCDLTGADMSRATLAGARLHGSTVDDLRGAGSLDGVVIDSTQLVPLGLGLLAAHHITIDDDPESEP